MSPAELREVIQRDIDASLAYKSARAIFYLRCTVNEGSAVCWQRANADPPLLKLERQALEAKADAETARLEMRGPIPEAEVEG